MPAEPTRAGGLDVVVVGGSLTGLSAALALSRTGHRVTVLERATGGVAGGSGIGLDARLFERVTGVPADRIPVVRGNRLSAAWEQVRAQLLAAVRESSLAGVWAGVTVTGVRCDQDGARVLTSDGLVPADVVVGADGARSTIRKYVAPEQPLATYAGYVLWRGLVDERAVAGGLSGRGAFMEFYAAPGARLTAYCVPDSDGSARVGERRVSFAWYDGGRTKLLRDLGCVSADNHVLATLYQSDMSPLLVNELRRLAGRLWPAPWSRAIQTAITQCGLFATPVAEYVPLRMVRDRVVIVGDAAHVASPMVGAGFRSGLLDVETLAQCLKDAAPGDVVRALEITQSQRIADARRMVRSGMGYGPDLLADSDEPVGDACALPSAP